MSSMPRRALKTSASKPGAMGVANSTLMAIMARMSAYTGQTVSWEPAMSSTESLVPESLDWGAMPFPPVAIPGQSKLA